MSDWQIPPMLAQRETLTAAEAEKLNEDDEWASSQKLDGDRLMVYCHDGKIMGLTRKGTITLVPDKVAEAFRWFDGEWCFDGELVEGRFQVFDMPRALDLVSVSTAYDKRQELLAGMWPQLDMPDCVQLVRSETTTEGKRDLLRSVTDNNGEGVVFKRRDAGYAPSFNGNRSSLWRKRKLYEEASCIVLEPWREGKRSMSVAVIDENTGEVVNVGSVTMTPENLNKVDTGTIVDIKYLYVDSMDSPRLYQPAFIRVRTDIEKTDCTLSQLKVTSRAVV